jgi:hypothetical protein
VEEARQVGGLRIMPTETFYEADIEFCLTGEADPGLDPAGVAFSFAPRTTDNRNFGVDGVSYRGDYLVSNFRPIAEEECVRGPVGSSFHATSKWRR